jgi:predicted nucleic acid-binding protein
LPAVPSVPESILVDAGPLVAWLNRKDGYHAWAREQFARLRPPLLTCEPVLTEVAFLLEAAGLDAAVVPDLITRSILDVSFSLEDEAATVSGLMRRYRNVPMSLADACLVRLSEVRQRSRIFTLDSDFRIYRRHGRLIIPTLMPARI